MHEAGTAARARRHAGFDRQAVRRGTRNGAKSISLALQGGGAHGAFTWGVLDRLLEDGRLAVEAVSGSSAGAMNGVVLVDGLARGGPDAAREQLERFWQHLSDDNAAISEADELLDALCRFWRLPKFSAYDMMEEMSPMMSPYDFEPSNSNPLETLIESVVDFDRVRHHASPKLFLAATNVRTGKARVFTNKEINASVVTASACVPYLFRAVEIDGEHYWDGGYSGNPSLWPLFRRAASRDILLVQVVPSNREAVPRTPEEIVERISEITFNSALLHELRAIEIVDQMMEEEQHGRMAYERNRLHRIEATEVLKDLHGSTRLDISWSFLKELRDAGREVAGRWLADSYEGVGKRATLDFGRELA